MKNSMMFDGSWEYLKQLVHISTNFKKESEFYRPNYVMVEELHTDHHGNHQSYKVKVLHFSCLNHW